MDDGTKSYPNRLSSQYLAPQQLGQLISHGWLEEWQITHPCRFATENRTPPQRRKSFCQQARGLGPEQAESIRRIPLERRGATGRYRDRAPGGGPLPPALAPSSRGTPLPPLPAAVGFARGSTHSLPVKPCQGDSSGRADGLTGPLPACLRGAYRRQLAARQGTGGDRVAVLRGPTAGAWVNRARRQTEVCYDPGRCEQRPGWRIGLRRRAQREPLTVVGKEDDVSSVAVRGVSNSGFVTGDSEAGTCSGNSSSQTPLLAPKTNFANRTVVSKTRSAYGGNEKRSGPTF